MKEPEIPENEKERLAALRSYHILDTIPEQGFDDLTLLASHVCGTPISLVSLIDEDRQWFKSHRGLEVSETPRELAFCAHAILEPDRILQVPDATQDARFAESPLTLGEPHIRFYAGAPLIDPDGFPLGTLCVIDQEPKVLTPEQVEALLALSRQVVTQLELRRRCHLLELSRNEVERARIAAAEANRIKGEFLANISHEIRTPMNGIIGMSEILRGTLLDQKQKEYLGMVSQSADDLLEIINDILDFSKIESGQIELEDRDFCLRSEVGETLRTFSSRVFKKGIETAFDIAPEIPDNLVGDLGRFRQVLINLVGNSLKFTENGEILVTIEPAPNPANNPGDKDAIQLHVSVSDTGIGIPEEKQIAIFESFTQADGSITRAHGGTGLGLTISRQLVDLMGGNLWLESTPGEGSTFHFTANFTVAKDAITPGPVPSLAGLPVLVVDDHEASRRILERMLTCWGMRPTLAANGNEALEQLAEADAAGTPIRLILLDLLMPKMDGLEVTRRIAEDKSRITPEILLLSPAGLKLPWDEMASLGISHTISKPVEQEPLLDAISDRFGTASLPGAHNTTLHPGIQRDPLRSLRILIAEDVRVNWVAAARMIEARGHEAVIVNDGFEVVETFLSDPGFNAILMDVQMPRLDGYQATMAIRKHEKGSVTRSHIPIIAFTAHALGGDREKCLAAGMDDYLTKPLRSKELFRVLDRLLPPAEKT